MAVNGLFVADSDMHVMEPADLWPRDMGVKVKNAVMLRLGRARPRAAGRPWKADQDPPYTHAEERGWDAKSQVMAMEMEHLDSAVLFPSRGLFVLSLQSTEHVGSDGLEPELASAIARAYNDWMFDFVQD